MIQPRATGPRERASPISGRATGSMVPFRTTAKAVAHTKASTMRPSACRCSGGPLLTAGVYVAVRGHEPGRPAIATPPGGPYTAPSRGADGDRPRRGRNLFGTPFGGSESAHEEADGAGRAAGGEPAARRVRRGSRGGGGVFRGGAGVPRPARAAPLRGRPGGGGEGETGLPA